MTHCPRCNGKGHVGKDDIRRLDLGPSWLPGPCALCHGTGRVTEVDRKGHPVDPLKPKEGMNPMLVNVVAATVTVVASYCIYTYVLPPIIK